MSNPSTLRFQFEDVVWIYANPAANYFVTLPREMSEEILDVIGNNLNPWGTVPCSVTVKDFTWLSSMFPRKERHCYDLPLNAKVRKRLGLQDGDTIAVSIEIALPY